MKKLIFYIIIVLLIGFSCGTAAAQRTSLGRAFISVSQVTSFSCVPSGGIHLEGGQYLLNSYWSAGAKVTDWNQPVSLPEKEHFDHVVWGVRGAWMYRILGTYSRMLNVYAGGGVFIGGNSYEVFSPLPDEYAGAFAESEFAYGVEPAVEVELFAGSRVAFTLGAQLPVTFSSYYSRGMWLPTASLGIRINL